MRNSSSRELTPTKLIMFQIHVGISCNQRGEVLSFPILSDVYTSDVPNKTFFKVCFCIRIKLLETKF